MHLIEQWNVLYHMTLFQLDTENRTTVKWKTYNIFWIMNNGYLNYQ